MAASLPRGERRRTSHRCRAQGGPTNETGGHPMRRRSIPIAVGLACLLFAARQARAVDEPIPGDMHQVQEGQLAKMNAKADGSFDLPVGDPTAEGGELLIIDTGGGSPPMQVDLPADGWKTFKNKKSRA